MEAVLGVLRAVRTLRTEQRISQTKRLAAVQLDIGGAAPALADQLRSLAGTLQAIGRCEELRFEAAEGTSELAGVRVGIVPMPPVEKPQPTA